MIIYRLYQQSTWAKTPYANIKKREISLQTNKRPTQQANREYSNTILIFFWWVLIWTGDYYWGTYS